MILKLVNLSVYYTCVLVTMVTQTLPYVYM